ncbi:hypothetical protein [uncultured Ruegeria sp.]|uniref:hypothetical protein n=1 Tax=uncultured Ruegeria sp. TaxID=259304 RepID=UPI00262DA858|nr:hypothetical protein [uncultured Ruegeria sp.]
MLGWKIFAHSVRIVFRNLREALQIGLVPSVAAAVFSAVVSSFTDQGTATETGSLLSTSPEDAFLLFGTAVMSFIVTLWIFVAWHRFVLLEEYPTGWIPGFKADRFFDYVGYTFLLIVICVISAVGFSMPVVLIVSLLSTTIPVLGSLAQFLPLIIVILVYVTFLRLGTVLPAAAIGAPFGLKAAKNATSGTNGTLIVTATTMLIVQGVFGLILFQSSQLLPIVGIASQTIIGLIISLVNVSVLTTVYGIYVEKRELT